MARSHAQIHVAVWGDPDFRQLTMGAQWAYMALISQKETTHAGTVPLMIRKWSKLCADSNPDRIEAALDELEKAGFVYWDEDTYEVLVRSFIRNDGVAKQPNVLKSAVKCVVQIESVKLRSVAGVELARVLESLPQKSESAAMVQVIALIRDSLQSLGPKASDLQEETLPEGFPEPFAQPFTEGWGEGEGEGEGEGAVETREISTPRATTPTVAQSVPLGVIPEDWRPSPNTLRWAELRYSNLFAIDDEVAKFVNHAQDKGRRSENPDAAFKNWLINAKRFASERTDGGRGSGPAQSKSRTWLDVAREADQRQGFIEGHVIDMRELG